MPNYDDMTDYITDTRRRLLVYEGEFAMLQAKNKKLEEENEKLRSELRELTGVLRRALQP